MAIFEYRALNTQGKSIKGLIDADSPQDARSKLRRDNIYPFQLKTASAPRRLAQNELFAIFQPKTKTKEIAVITRQLATLLKAGLPLMQALSALVDQIDTEHTKKIFIDIREKVKGGMPLSKAMAEHPQVFFRLYVQMVRAGEASGSLDQVLASLADYLEKKIRQKNKILSTLAYPAFMLFIGVVVLIFLMIYVIPTITTIFVEMKQSLPLPTVILIRLSELLKVFWLPLILALVLLILALDKYRRTESGGLLIDQLLLKLPIFGELIRKIDTARFAQTLYILVCNGVPILDSLAIVKEVITNRLLANAIEEARHCIQEGDDLAGPLKKAKVFPPIVTHMLAIGEKSGQLEEMLANIAEGYANEVDMAVNSLTSILEPAIILLMGAIVAFVVLSILLPIFEMNQIV
ncbi:MAG: type II secretion system inner membrane protein GspF [bacterium]|nr:type II secretion system inner membrane protein GspF [bacterium]